MLLLHPTLQATPASSSVEAAGETVHHLMLRGAARTCSLQSIALLHPTCLCAVQAYFLVGCTAQLLASQLDGVCQQLACQGCVAALTA